MTNVSFPVFCALLPIHILLASLVPCIAHSYLETWCILRPCNQPRGMIHSLTHKPHYIFLKTATIPTYHDISIAIPRYIAMQLPWLLFTWLVCSSSYCFAWSYRADMIFVAKPPFIIVIHVTLDHCTSWYTARGIHIESYYFSLSSCK
jgi:hypothetical protein